MPDDSTELWTGDVAPLLLTPVRLETRYLPVTDPTTPPLLAIRVIPDDIARYTFEPALTAAEHAAGTDYWAARTAGADPGAAWARVQSLLGDSRGAWAVEVTRPDSTISDPGTRTTVSAATSLILPDYFTFRGFRDGAQVFGCDGRPLPPDLCLGPDWSQLGGDNPTGQTPWTGGSRWMVDLTEAVRVGMAVTVPLAGTNIALDSITVVGVRGGSSADGADRLARTLQGHLYTSGLGYPPAGSPTNNTDTIRSQWTSAPTMDSPDEVTAAVAAAGPGQPAVTIADALGLSADTRPGVPGRRDLLAADQGATPGDDDLARRAHQLIAAYSDTLTGGRWLTSQEWVDHYVAFVRAAGPLPVLRVGRQPYGLLPVVDLFSWAPADPPDVDPGMYRTIVEARMDLDAVVGVAPHLTGDPHQDEDPVLLGILQRAPTAVRLRALNGRHTMTKETMPPGMADPYAPSVSVPFDLTPTQPTGPVDPNAWPLAKMSQAQFTGPADPKIVASCVSITDVTDDCHHNGLYWAVQAYAALHWQGALLSAHQAGASAADWQTLTAAIPAALRPLRDLEPDAAADWAAVDAHLADAVAALGERTDAWATSVATARLHTMRGTAATGIHLGMYGWLVDVAPLSDAARADECGWTLTPSPQHAVTASVLFAGAEAHNYAAFNIDLTSARVRRAQILLAGLRDGSTLEELLGYQLERALHDNQLDTAIPFLRKAYPLPVTPGVTLDASRTARLVTDGEAARRDSAAAAAVIEAHSTATAAVGAAIIGDLDDTVDGAADVLLAESVHHLVGGSPLRAGLALDTVGKAGPPPDRLTAISTPTAAVTVTHTVAVVVGGPDSTGGTWPTGPRATLDPAAEAIAAWALGGPDDWRVDVTDAATGAQTTLTPAQLTIGAIDLAVELTSPVDTSALAARARAQSGAAAGSVVAVRRTDGYGGPDAAALIAATVRTVLAVARPVTDPATLVDPALDPPTVQGLDDLGSRIGTWWAQVQAALHAGADAAGALAGLGVQGARHDASPATLAQLATRWGDTATLVAPPPTATGTGAAAAASAWLASTATAVRAVVGDWFTGSTAVTPSATGLPGAAPTSGAGDVDVAGWIAEHAPMCPGLSSVADLLLLSGACGAARTPLWTVRQLLAASGASPFAAPDTPGAWIGGSDTGGCSGTSLTAQQIGDPAAQWQMWVVVDHWAESLPLRVDPGPALTQSNGSDHYDGPTHDAALSLRFDSPDSRAPQALLLAVPSAPAAGWFFSDVQNAVAQTLQWAMLRPLDRDDLPERVVSYD